MIDIQKQKDKRGLPIDYVGVKNVMHPLLIPTKNNKFQQVSASINFYTDLAHDIRGIHMSRFIETIYENKHSKMTLEELKRITDKLKNKLGVSRARLEVNFDLFIIKQSPVSKKNSYSSYHCSIITETNCKKYNQQLIIEIPIMLLCPCSKAISKYNAHNQRAIVTLNIELIKPMHIEDIVDMVEKEGSCELYSILKRPDEKFVTEKSYNNPKFVEDVVRDIGLELKHFDAVQSAIIDCESQESIHTHNAFARLSINN